MKYLTVLLLMVALAFAGDVTLTEASAASGKSKPTASNPCEGWRCWNMGRAAGYNLKPLDFSNVGDIKRYKQGYWTGSARIGEQHGKVTCTSGRDRNVSKTIKKGKFRRAYKMGFRSGKNYIKQVYGPCKKS